MVQRSYIKFHPMTGYHRATAEIRRFYDGFEIYNFNDKFNPQRPIDDSNDDPATLQQVLTISYHYAPNFFNRMKNQKLDNLRRQGLDEKQIMELYIVLPEKALQMWLRLETLPGSYLENGTDDRHSWYNFHAELQYAINDFINIYLYNYPLEYSQPGLQLTSQPYYLAVVHTKERLLEVLQQDLRMTQGRSTNWHTRKTLDTQFQIQGERIGREYNNRTISIGKNMEIKRHFDKELEKRSWRNRATSRDISTTTL
eukprot:5126931-Amphidinium_carterae.3